MVRNISKALKGLRGHRKGFTLVELTAALAIIAIIALIAVPKFTGIIERAKKGADEATLKVLQNAVDMYRFDHNGKMPEKGDLKDTLEKDGYIEGGWPEPQIGESFEIDPVTGKVSKEPKNSK